VPLFSLVCVLPPPHSPLSLSSIPPPSPSSPWWVHCRHRRIRSLSSPARGIDAELAGSYESIFQAVGSDKQDARDLDPDEEGDLGENIWDEKGSVQLVDSDGPAKRAVKSGNLNQLILYFTEAQSANPSAGAEFTDAFMISFQTFCTPYQFVRKLCERYKVPPCPPGRDKEDYDANFKLPIQLRVIKIL